MSTPDPSAAADASSQSPTPLPSALTPLRVLCAVRTRDELSIVQQAYQIGAPMDLRLIHVIEDCDERIDELDRDLAAAERWLHELDAYARPPQARRAYCDVRIGASVEETLVQAAMDDAADLLIVGPAERDGDEIWEATLPERLTRRAPCSVLIARPKETPQKPRGVIDPAPNFGEGLTHYEPMAEPRYEAAEDRTRRAGIANFEPM